MNADIEINVESPLAEDGLRLIEASQKALEEVYPPDEIFSMDASELAERNVHFLVARLGGVAVGCIALVDMVGYGEIKRLFVDAPARGLGLGRRLIEAAEGVARDLGLTLLRLETGPDLLPAVKTYSDAGYVQCQRFGDYEDLPCSLFMEKSLLAREADRALAG